MDYQRFATRKAAKEEIAKMHGWDDIKAVKITDYDPETGKPADFWAIQCRTPGMTKNADPLYLRNDGYIR